MSRSGWSRHCRACARRDTAAAGRRGRQRVGGCIADATWRMGTPRARARDARRRTQPRADACGHPLCDLLGCRRRDARRDAPFLEAAISCRPHDGRLLGRRSSRMPPGRPPPLAPPVDQTARALAAKVCVPQRDLVAVPKHRVDHHAYGRRSRGRGLRRCGLGRGLVPRASPLRFGGDWGGASVPGASTACTPAPPRRSTWHRPTCSATRAVSASASAPIRASRSGRGGRYRCSGSASVQRSEPMCHWSACGSPATRALGPSTRSVGDHDRGRPARRLADERAVPGRAEAVDAPVGAKDAVTSGGRRSGNRDRTDSRRQFPGVGAVELRRTVAMHHAIGDQDEVSAALSRRQRDYFRRAKLRTSCDSILPAPG